MTDLADVMLADPRNRFPGVVDKPPLASRNNGRDHTDEPLPTNNLPPSAPFVILAMFPLRRGGRVVEGGGLLKRGTEVQESAEDADE